MADSRTRARSRAARCLAACLLAVGFALPCAVPAWASAPGPGAAGLGGACTDPTDATGAEAYRGGGSGRPDDAAGEMLDAGEPEPTVADAGNGSDAGGAASPVEGPIGEEAEMTDPLSDEGAAEGDYAPATSNAVGELGVWLAQHDAQALSAARMAGAAANEAAAEAADSGPFPISALVASAVALACAASSAACFAVGRSRRAPGKAGTAVGAKRPHRSVMQENEGSLCL